MQLHIHVGISVDISGDFKCIFRMAETRYFIVHGLHESSLFASVDLFRKLNCLILDLI